MTDDELAGSAVEAVCAAPAQTWVGDDGPRFGPAFDALPAAIVQDGVRGEPAVSLGDLVGVLWKAVEELAARVATLEATPEDPDA